MVWYENNSVVHISRHIFSEELEFTMALNCINLHQKLWGLRQLWGGGGGGGLGVGVEPGPPPESIA